MTAWMHYFQGKVIWITGASSGLGASLYQQLSAVDCTLVISGRNEAKLQQLAQLREQVHILAFDVQHANKHHEAAAYIKQNIGKLDMVFFNAGGCDYVTAEQFNAQPFEHMISTNFMSVVHGLAATLPLLKQSQHGHIIGISSAIAYGGLGRASAYGASKAAMKNMLECLRIDLLDTPVFVTIACPGFIDTPLTKKNRFEMPGLISANQAAKHILKKTAANQYEVITPRWFCYLMKLIHSIPTSLGLLFTKHTR